MPTGLVQRHQEGLTRYLRYLGCPEDLVDDLTQESFLTCFRVEFEDRNERSTGAYLRTIARNLFLKERSKAGKNLSMHELDVADEVWQQRASDGGDSYISNLRYCLAKLGSAARTALELQYAVGASRADIAKRLGMRPDGVKSLMRRLRLMLRECVLKELSREDRGR